MVMRQNSICMMLGHALLRHDLGGIDPLRLGMGIALRRIAFAVIAFAAFCALAADSLTMADFNHKIKLQVDGYTGSETLVNFPVLVRISESGIPGFLYADMSAWNNAHTQTYGHDLAFFASASVVASASEAVSVASAFSVTAAARKSP